MGVSALVTIPLFLDDPYDTPAEKLLESSNTHTCRDKNLRNDTKRHLRVRGLKSEPVRHCYNKKPICSYEERPPVVGMRPPILAFRALGRWRWCGG